MDVKRLYTWISSIFLQKGNQSPTNCLCIDRSVSRTTTMHNFSLVQGIIVCVTYFYIIGKKNHFFFISLYNRIIINSSMWFYGIGGVKKKWCRNMVEILSEYIIP